MDYGGRYLRWIDCVLGETGERGTPEHPRAISSFRIRVICTPYWAIIEICTQYMSIQFLDRKCLLADRYGLPIRDYWQTVQKIFMCTSALLQSFEQCRYSSSFVQSIRGLPTRRNCQNDYIFCERSANNL